MNAASQGSPLLFLGGPARSIAAWMALVGALVSFGLSWWLSWPLGPDFVDESGVTRIRLAIATLVFGQILSFIFLIFYQRDLNIAVRRFVFYA